MNAEERRGEGWRGRQGRGGGEAPLGRQAAGDLSVEAAAVRVLRVAGRARAALGHRVADGHGAAFDVHRLEGPVAVTHPLLGQVPVAPVDRILTQTRASVQCRNHHHHHHHLQTAKCSFTRFSYLLVALTLTYRGEDLLGASAALHEHADVGWTTAEAAALPRPRQRQHRCHDDQLHPLPGAVPDTCHGRGPGGGRK